VTGAARNVTPALMMEWGFGLVTALVPAVLDRKEQR